jgi:Aldose 1-epimerase
VQPSTCAAPVLQKGGHLQVWDAEKTAYEGSPAVRLTYRSKNGEEVSIRLQCCHKGWVLQFHPFSECQANVPWWHCVGLPWQCRGSRDICAEGWRCEAGQGLSACHHGGHNRSGKRDSSTHGKTAGNVTMIVNMSIETIVNCPLQATPINMAQHTYWNLAGSGDILGHNLSINACVRNQSSLCMVYESRVPVEHDIAPAKPRTVTKLQGPLHTSHRRAHPHW